MEMSLLHRLIEELLADIVHCQYAGNLIADQNARHDRKVWCFSGPTIASLEETGRRKSRYWGYKD